ncbi:uncharacterized protein LOC135400058 [Ornithodoros turicata]|uniref:uncharacterized protein LOC135400058 n=1 Tax=Ornithodoros turicata TaxID=34597 RepID=UPI00313A4D20
MKVVAFSLMLFGLLKVVTSDCPSVTEAMSTCAKILKKSLLYDDAFIYSLNGQEKADLMCCVYEDMTDCILIRNTEGNCTYLADISPENARAFLIEKIKRAYGDVPCDADAMERCSALRSRVV